MDDLYKKFNVRFVKQPDGTDLERITIPQGHAYFDRIRPSVFGSGNQWRVKWERFLLRDAGR